MLSFNTVNQRTVNHATDDAILIVGKAETEFKNREIVKPASYSDVEYLYGSNSELTAAYKEAMLIGATNVFLCNCFKFTDYILMAEDIAKENFAYITPLFKFSETFALKDNSSMYLCEFYSNMLSENITQLFVSDNHASLYENLDHFLRSTNSIVSTFKNATTNKLLNGNNLCFISNVLKNYKYANVALASILQQSDLKYYPQKDIGDVVFDLNNLDFIGQEVAYFAYDINAKTTIENFLNFSESYDAEKFVPVSIVIQKIRKSLDFSDYKGKLFSPYMRVSLENKIEGIMREYVGVLIESYSIKSIRVFQMPNRTVGISIYITIKPYNSIEEIGIEMEM